MARIYIARTTGIGSFERHVVLKLITPERANDVTAVQMFLDEARLAASLNHQNVAQVFEVGEDAGIHYLAMEYVHGQDLRALLARAGSQGVRVPIELSLTVVAGAAAGLNHAHERRGPDGTPLGIVHRDVSPSNIMIGYDGAVKLLDFGIAKATHRSVETQSGIIKGKFAYMAPEQCRGRDVDRRSDVFSLGIILYEITTQHRCFRADSDFDTMHRIVTGDVVRPTRLIQGYPPALEAIVMKALAVDANQRYQSASLLLEAIEQFAVSGRMSLSTMALGRFMREMFGELPEPWLTAGRGSSPPPPKESTISSTNGAQSSQSAQSPRPPAASSQAPTVLEPAEAQLAEWAAKSHPHGAPAYAAPLPAPPETPVPVLQPQGSQPIAPVAFPPGPGSGSGVAHPGIAPLPSTRHGYAGSELSYPRYEPPVAVGTSEDDLRVRPNRTPLFIGIGVVVIGAAVAIAMTIGGSGGNVDPIGGGGSNRVVTTPTPAVAPSVAPAAIDAPAAEETVEEQSISIKVESDPPGADVMLNGKVIGTTPLDTKRPKGSGSAYIIVHKTYYEDVTTRLDMSGDFETKVVLKKTDGPTPAEDAALKEQAARDKKAEELRKQQDLRDKKAEDRRKAADEARKQQEARDKKAEDLRKQQERDRKADELRKQQDAAAAAAAKPKQAKCQDPGRFNAFDTSCAGQAGALKDGVCPPCPTK